MARVIRSILFLLLVVVLHVTASSHIAEETLCNAPVVLSSSQHSVDHAQLPYFPDAELGNTSFYLQEVGSDRTSRIFLGSAFSLRSIIQLMAEHEAMLFKHWQKQNDVSFLSSIVHPISEYYIFALRHIII